MSVAEGLSARLSSATRRSFAWGFVDQGLSSATNFLLSLLAGRLLGPSGLGAISVGFASYLALLGLHRALLTEPLVASSSALSAEDRRARTRLTLAVSIAVSLLAGGLVAVAGAALGGSLGRALLLFSPWIPAVLVQDFWRAVLFRDGRARAAAIQDGVWLVVMGATAGAAWWIDAQWAVIACWGIGGLAAMLLGLAQTRSRPARPSAALAWWRRELWPFGRWLGLNSALYAALSYGLVFALAGVLGTARLGGLQSVITVFAPLSLVASAIALPGLPAVSQALASSERSARRLALRVGGASAAVTALYVGVLGLGGGWVLRALFGHSFSKFSHLVWPIGAGQVLAASAVGLTLLLKAHRRGRAVLISSTAGSAAALGLGIGLAATHGTTGAAWGISAGAALGAAVTAAVALRTRPA